MFPVGKNIEDTRTNYKLYQKEKLKELIINYFWNLVTQLIFIKIFMFTE